MNRIPTPQEANIIDGVIVNTSTFWGPIEEGTNWPYSNNFFSGFEKGRILRDFKEYLDIDSKNFQAFEIEKYFLSTLPQKEKWSNYSITEESNIRYITKLISFAEYYRAFPDEVKKLIELTDNFENLSAEISNYVSSKTHNLTGEYINGIYHAYSYMRTQPGTSDAILTA